MRYLYLILPILFFIGCSDSKKSDNNETSFSVNDTFFNQQWHLTYDSEYANTYNVATQSDINVIEAWQRTRGKGVKVAVIDDHFDTTHPDLKDQIIATYDVDDNDTDVGRDETFNSASHGTPCAGIIGAKADGNGVVGVAPESSLILIKLNLQGDYYTIKALQKAAELGADVISCSWGTYDVSEAVETVIHDLATNGRDGKGIVIVFAAGNNHYDLDNSLINDESELDDVIGVSASDENALMPYYANWGSKLDLLAPGGDWLGLMTIDEVGSEYGNNKSYDNPDYIFPTDYNYFSGTSASAPIVAGAAALLLSYDSNLTKIQVQELLESTTDKIGGDIYDENGWNDNYLYGKINIGKTFKEF